MHSFPVGLLVCDFDETITQNDSICELANLAYDKRAKQGKCPPSPPNCPPLNDKDEECPPPWSYFVELYFKEYKEHVKRWHERNPDDTIQDHFKMLESLKKVENISIDRIERYDCMKGVCDNELIEKGKSIKKREDVLNTLKKFISKPKHEINGMNIHMDRNLYIISTNWSKDVILGSLFELVLEYKFDKRFIYSNDLIFNNNCTTGKLNRKVLCATDKLEIFKQFHTPKDTLSVYIGDSDTDLPCLLQANIGIIMGNNKTLTKYCNKYGIVIVEGLTDRVEIYDGTEQKNGKLYRVQGWKEIADSGLLN
ncbi:9560_t:CDS:2 [Funneliformis mosseae]|uniref:9560_t:CDS:1 n=1 Tax=Funneliformis mosseae TaxID=27381 RepID=A0A9N9AYP1_FUNMO|nr:9560_t:CDS:2 [Funneliformis mosseae]